MKTLDFRSYVTLERAVTRRLQFAWKKQSESTYAAIAKACQDHQWDAARRLVPDLDLTEVGTENRESLKYLLRSLAIFGAGMVSKKHPNFLSVGNFDDTLNRVTQSMLLYLEHKATAQVQAQALQLIAEDEAKSKAVKREFEYGNTQLDIDPTSSAASTINKARDRIADEDCAGNGKDTSNHITVRYGLLNEDLDDLRGYLASLTPFEVRVGHIEVFPVSEHSEGTCPVVVRVLSPELHGINEEIGKHADFKESSFPTYKPHCTLAYVDPDETDKYKNLYVDGSFVCQGITISHASGVQETIPFGSVRKADPTGRFVTPFVSFDKQGEDQLQLIASLNSSRLATWGFTAEADLLGITSYRLTAVLDGRTSKFCRLINGREFDVKDARQKVVEALSVTNPEDLRSVQPWPKQTKQALHEFKEMTNDELRDRGLHIPPFHPRCRTICHRVGKDYDIRLEKPLLTQPTPIQNQVTTHDSMLELGLHLTPQQLDHWNAYVNLNPVEVLSHLSGQPALTLLKYLPKNSLVFEDNGDIQINTKGILNSVKYAIGTVLDPYTGTYYLTHADLVGDAPQAQKYFKTLLHTLITTGESMAAQSLVVEVSGQAYDYAKLGFLPDTIEWDLFRSTTMESLHSGELHPLFQSLSQDTQLLIEQMLGNPDEQTLTALINLQLNYQGKLLGQWILRDTQGKWSLNLNHIETIEHAQAQLS